MELIPMSSIQATPEELCEAIQRGRDAYSNLFGEEALHRLLEDDGDDAA